MPFSIVTPCYKGITLLAFKLHLLLKADSVCTHNYYYLDCYTKREAEECETQPGSIWFNLTCFNSTDIATYYVYAGNNCTNVSMVTTVATAADCVNLTTNVVIDSVNQRNSASEEYYMQVAYQHCRT